MIQITNLTKKYGKLLILDNINIALPRTGIVALVGNNGAGKTTLMKIIIRHIKATSGSVSVLDSESAKTVAKNIHFMNENNQYYSFKLKSIIADQKEVDKDFDVDKCNKILEIFKLDINKSYTKSSKGQTNLFNIAMALASSKKILLMDEPASGLDEMGRHNFYKMLADEMDNQGRLMVVSTHMLEELSNIATEIILLQDHGKIMYGDIEYFSSQFVRLVGNKEIMEKMLLSRWRCEEKYLGEVMSCIVVNDLSYQDKKTIKSNNMVCNPIEAHESCRILANDKLFEVRYDN